jgi:Protein of unknown function (DUF3108)
MSTALLRAMALGFLGIVLPGITLPAYAEAIGARYEIYTGGFQAIGIRARAVVTEHTYDVTADLKTTGVIDWILRFSQKAEVRGRFGSSTTPLLYLTDGTFFGTPRTTRLDYRADGRIEATLQPSTEDGERTPLTEDMKLGTLDPMSAFVAVNRSARETGAPCNTKLPVFDGRRRFNIVLEEDGVTAVEPSRYTAFSGAALRCKFSMERLGGFQVSPRFNARPPPVSTLFLARFGDGAMWLPVRLESDSTFGLVIGHLVEVDAPVRPLGRGLRPAS